MSEDTESGRAKSSEEIEREVEQTRARVTETLEELRERMSPTQIVDQVVTIARDSGGADLLANAGKVIKAHPLPFLVIGAGLAWLAVQAAKPAPKQVEVIEDDEFDDDELSLAERYERPPLRVAPGEYGAGTGDDGSRLGAYPADKIADEDEGNGPVAAATERLESLRRSTVIGAERLRARARRTAAGGAQAVAEVWDETVDVVDGAGERIAQGASSAGSVAGRALHAVSSAAHTAYDTVSDVAGKAVHVVSDTAGDVREVAGEAGGQIYAFGRAAGERAADFRKSAGETVMSYRETAGSAVNKSKEAINNVIDYQPVLVVGALGFAIGAVIGAALPSTRTENRLMGDQSDELKERAKEFATAQVDRARAGAGRIYEEVKDELENQDFASLPSEMIAPVTERVRTVAETARLAALEEADEFAADAEEALDSSVEAVNDTIRAAGDKASAVATKAGETASRFADTGRSTVDKFSRGAKEMSDVVKGGQSAS